MSPVGQLVGCFILCLELLVLHSKNLFVSHRGKDSPDCGNSSRSPCASVLFTVVNVSQAGDVINIDYFNGKPYMECISSDHINIPIRKSLSLVGWNGKAVIHCNPKHLLFLISGEDVKAVLFKNLVMEEGHYAIYQESSSSTLTVESCLFKRNYIAICFDKTQCLLQLFNSTFKNNSPHGYGILATRCFTTRVNLTSSLFNFSSMSIETSQTDIAKSIQVFVSQCKFVEHIEQRMIGLKSNNYTSLFYIGWYAVDAAIEIEICDSHFANLRRGMQNKLNANALCITHDPKYPGNRTKTSIILNRLKFENISSIMPAVNISDFNLPQKTGIIEVKNSIFYNTNASMRISVKKFQSRTINDSAIPYVFLTNNTFENNHCNSKSNPHNHDGHILSLSTGVFSIERCQFIDNSLGDSGTGAVVFLMNRAGLQINNSYFENNQIQGDCMQIEIEPRSYAMISETIFNIKKLRSSQKIIQTEAQDFPDINFSPSPLMFSWPVEVQCPNGYNANKVAKKQYLGKQFHKEYPLFYAYLDFALSCVQCPRKTYSLKRGLMHNRTVSEIKCHNCPRGGQCEHGKIKAKPNFWGYVSHSQILFLPCPSGYCCQEDNCESYNSCNGNRTDQLCARCHKGMSETLFSTKCKTNEKCQNYMFWVGVSVLPILSFLFFLFHNEITIFLRNGLRFQSDSANRFLCYLQVSGESSIFLSRDKNKIEEIGYLKIIFYYYQVIHIFKNTVDSKDKYNLLNNLQSQVTKSLNLILIHISSIDCPFQNITPIKKTILLHSIGVCLLGITVVTYLIWKACKQVQKDTATRINAEPFSVNLQGVPSDHGREDLMRRQSFYTRIICAFVHISLLMYSSTTQLVFTLLRCVPFKDHHILFIDGTVQCFQTFQYALLGYTVVSSLPFFLVPVLGSYVLKSDAISVFQFCLGCLFPLPFCCYWFYLLMKQNSSHNETSVELISEDDAVRIESSTGPSGQAVLDLLSGPFRSHKKRLCFPSSHLPWEGVLILRRLVIVLAFTFIYDTRVRMMVILTICVIILISHLYVKPFRDAMENFFETLSLGTLAVLCGFTLVKALLHGEDYSSFYTSSKILEKFNLIESILILAPATFVTVVALLRIFIKLAFLVSSCLYHVYKNIRNWFILHYRF